MVSIEAFLKGDEVIASFPSNELREGGFTSPRYACMYIALCDGYIRIYVLVHS